MSDSKKKKAAAKKGGKALKGSASASQLSEAENSAANGLAGALEEFALNDRSTTGVLTSHPQSRDIHFDSFTLLYHGHELLTDTRLELNYGRCVKLPAYCQGGCSVLCIGPIHVHLCIPLLMLATPARVRGAAWLVALHPPAATRQRPAASRSSRRRYGLIGPNGCGKSCLLKALGARDLEIPQHIDVYLLDREIPASDMTALEVGGWLKKARAIAGPATIAMLVASNGEPPAAACCICCCGRRAPPLEGTRPRDVHPCLSSLRRCSQAVKSVDDERARLEAEAEALADQQGDEVEARLEDIYER